MKRNNGNFENFNNSIIGKFTYKNNIFSKDKILFCNKEPLFKFGIKALFVPNNIKINTSLPIFHFNENLKYNEGDIIRLNKDGESYVVWDINEKHNALYVTDICNSKCIMCPQVEGSKSRYEECIELLDYVNLKNCENIGITGGEPTTNIDKLSTILEKITSKNHQLNIHILTNGRNFQRIENVQKIAKIGNNHISFGIPLYSNIAEEHDYIVGVKGAFQETIRGLYNLAKYKQKIEIRIVIMKQNYYKLEHIAEFIYRNFPFVTHIALMGMEYHGNAETNYNIVHIDSYNYKEELYAAVRSFVRYNMIVDVYNIPLCLADKRIYEFCRDSISTWKKMYLSQCENCKKKHDCCGVFETSFKYSENIKPIFD